MLRSFRPDDAALAAVERVRMWTRQRFALDDASAVFVAELACAVPGCPPIETVVGFWTPDGVRHHFKVFKPAAAVEAGDLPPAWYLDALVVDADATCSC
ncbi:MAG: hypothetical protein ABIS17_17075 [Casimicrobiaceae bacterium]